MFVIFGSPRSGTTILSSSLDLHSQIIVPDETDFIIPLAFIVDRVHQAPIGKEMIKNLIINGERYKVSLGEYLSQDEVFAAIDKADYNAAAILESIYSSLAEKAGKKIAGDKSPNDIMFSYMLEKVGFFNSDIKIIHIVRNIRDVIVSLQELQWVPEIEKFFPRIWCESNLFLHNLLKEQTSRYLLVKFEDLITDPRKNFEKIFDLLELPHENGVFEYKNRNDRYKKMPHHSKLHKPFLPDEIGVWRKELSPKDIELCQEQASEALQHFGYSNRSKFINYIYKLWNLQEKE